MKTMSFFSVVVVALLLAQDARVRAQETVTLGLLLPYTGALPIGNDLEVAANLALEDINELDRNKWRFEYDIRDTETNPSVAQNAASSLISSGAAAIIGPGTSDAALATFPVCHDAVVPMMAYSVTTPLFTVLPDKDDLFTRVVPSDSFQGRSLSDILEANGYTKVAIIYENTAYGNGIFQSYLANFDDQTVYAASINSTAGPANNITGIIGDMQATAPQILIIAALLDNGAEILKVMQAQEINLRVYVTDTLSSEDLITDAFAGSAAIGVAGLKPPALGSRAWRERIFDAQDEDEIFTYQAEIYDAIVMVAKAIVDSNSANGTDIRRELRIIGKLYEGESGTITFDENGDRIGGTYDFWQWQFIESPESDDDDCDTEDNPVCNCVIDQVTVGLWSQGLITLRNLNQNLDECRPPVSLGTLISLPSVQNDDPTVSLYTFGFDDEDGASSVFPSPILLIYSLIAVGVAQSWIMS